MSRLFEKADEMRELAAALVRAAHLLREQADIAEFNAKLEQRRYEEGRKYVLGP